MSFESAIYNRLANDATLTGLCPSLYPQQPIDNTDFPFMWYSFKRQDSLVFGAVATGISNYVFEINCFAKTQAAVQAMANRVIALLDGFKSQSFSIGKPIDVGMLVLEDEAQVGRPGDGYIYFVKSLRFTGIEV